MKTIKLVILLASVPLASAALMVGLRYSWHHWLGSAPRLECPRSLDLGERYRGDIAVARFRVKNSGSGMLTADDFQTGCSCAAVEREIDGHLSPVQSIALSPGEEIELAVRIGVVVRPGESQHVHVAFATNDSLHPTHQIEVVIPRVKGGFFAEPAAVIFGSLTVGEKMSRTIECYDNGMTDRTVASVRATHPDRFSVKLVPLSEEDNHRVHPTAGKLFARVEVTPRTERAGRLDGEVQILLTNDARAPEPIPVAGEVLGSAECRPASLVLPRRVENRSVFAGDVLVLNRHEKPIEVAIDTVPPEISAEVQAISGRPDQRLLHIEWRSAAKQQSRPVSEARVRLRVSSAGEKTDLEVPVLLTENRP
jgi:hypothetical protein